MNDLTPEDEALLQLARGVHEPTEVDRARVRAGLLAGLGVSAGLTVGTTATSATAGVSVAAKVFFAIVVAGALGGGGLWIRNANRPALAPVPLGLVASVASDSPTTATTVAPRASRTPTHDAVLPQPEANDALTGPLSGTDPVPRGTHPHAKGSEERGLVAATPPVATAAPTADDATPIASRPPLSDRPGPSFAQTPTRVGGIEAETQLVAEGVSALHNGDAARALALFDEHARVYPAGILAEERASERVMALCVLGRRSEAQAAARDLLLLHPRSPLALRAQRSCPDSLNP